MKKKVLLVDDEKAFNFLHVEIIKSSGIDCAIQTALNGQEALSVINRCISDDLPVPDVIVTDLNMPVMNGFEFISIFQHFEYMHIKDTTVVVLTSSVNDADKMQALELGVDHYISKPLTETDVIQILLG